MPWGATTLGRQNRIVFGDSPYTASEGEIVEADTTGGDITVNLPPIGTGGKRVTVKKIGQNTNVVFIETLDQLESTITGSLTNRSILLSEAETITYYADETDNAWRIYAQAHAEAYTEAFTATPAAVGAAAPILWTFTPLYTGQTQVLTSYAAGTFTFNFDGSIDFKLSILWEFDLTGNNQDASGRVDSVFSGAGLDLFIPMSFPFAHTRSGSFLASQSTEGVVDALKTETYRFDASEDLGQSGNTLINSGYLFMWTQ